MHWRALPLWLFNVFPVNEQVHFLFWKTFCGFSARLQVPVISWATYCTRSTVKEAFHLFQWRACFEMHLLRPTRVGGGNTNIQNSHGSVACICAFMPLWTPTLTDAPSMPPQTRTGLSSAFKTLSLHCIWRFSKKFCFVDFQQWHGWAD